MGARIVEQIARIVERDVPERRIEQERAERAALM